MVRKTLCSLYPGNYIPPLPIKTKNANKSEKLKNIIFLYKGLLMV